MKQLPPDLQLYALTAKGAERLHPQPPPDPFYSLYQGLEHGLYEAARTYDRGRLFAYDRHHERLENGCVASNIEMPFDEATLRSALQQIIDEHPQEQIKLRWDLYPTSVERLGTHARMIATATPLPVLEPWILEEGVPLRTTAELVRVNPSTKGSRFAIERNRVPFGGRDNFEPLLVSEDGHLLEGAMSNFGAFLDDVLFASTRAALPGVTIGALIDLAQADGIQVEREPLMRTQIVHLQEAFLCSSVRGIVPVTSINGRKIGAGTPGPKVLRLLDRYSIFAESNAKRLV